MAPDDIKEAMILRVQPGDALVLKLGHELSSIELTQLKDRWRATFQGTAAAEAPLVILNPSEELSVLRGDKDRESTEIARKSFKNAQA